MEIVSVCTSLLPTIDQYIIKPLTRRVSYVFNYRRNVAELRDKVQTLAGARENLQKSVEAAGREGKEIHQNVEDWLAKAEKATEEAEMLVQGEEDAKKKRCFAGLCPDLNGRYQLGKRAAEEASTIVNLVNEGKFAPNQIAYLPAPRQLVLSSVHGFEDLPSRASILERVMDAVTDPNVNVVGVYGMGGVGKTTLVKEVHKQATEGKLFDVVALVTLSQKAEPKSIQGDIAEVLGLKLEEQTIEVRANRLHERLKKEKKVLIILDNLWEEIDLGRLGISLTEKQTVSSRGEDDHKRCTILLTSRNRDLLTCTMGAQKEFSLALLPVEESLSLLKRKVGDLKVPESLAIDVAKKCAGLPLLLATVAIGLKNKELEVWKDTLKRLSYFDDQQIQEKVHSVLELSYGDLAWEEARSFFLLCGLFPHADISILDLLKYSMGLGLLKRVDTVQDARNRVHSLIGELKSSFLLLDSEEDGCVRIHDIVQDVATSIAFRDHLAFKKVGGPPEGGQSADVKCFKRIFLEGSDISEFRLWLQCPDIEFFRLSVQDRSVKIPDDLFEGITKLKVLNFAEMRFSSLPSSLSSVTSLDTLCLDGCRLQDISVIWQLKNLEVLSLRDSDIDELPRDLMQLKRLKMLDLTDCYSLEFIPEDVLSRLPLLEELHMGNSFTNWEVKRLDDKINASLSDLKQLSRLTYLEIDVPDANKLPKELFSKGLERFKISIGDGWDWWGRYKTSRTLKLKLHTDIHSWGQGVEILLEKVEDLYLDEVEGVTNVLCDLHKEGFPQLKHLLVQKAGNIRYIIDEHRPSVAFPILDSLILHNLVNLEKIYQGRLMTGDFCQLKILKVKSCNKLKNLFPFSMVRNLKQLLEMKVMDCSDIEEIFTDETEEEEGDKNKVFEFTQLHSLKLRLPLLRRFCSKAKSSPACTSSAHPRENQSTIDPQCPLFNEMIVFPNLKDLKLSSIAVENIWWDQFGDQASFYNLTSLTVEACSKINSLFTPKMVIRNLGQLQRLEICECKSMEEVIAAEGETTCTTSFPKLKFLKLKGLSKLIRFFSGDFMKLPSLKELWIENCPALKSFITNPIATTTSRANLALFNEKVAFPNLEELHIEDMIGLKMIWQNEMVIRNLGQLQRLEICKCELIERVIAAEGEMISKMSFPKLEFLKLEGLLKLVRFCSNDFLELRSLKELWIGNCPVLKSFISNPIAIATSGANLALFDEKVVIPNLKELHIEDMIGLKMLWQNEMVIRNLEQLQRLEICKCELIEGVIAVEGEMISKMSFPKLEFLKLEGLSKLVRFCSSDFLELRSLKELWIENCPALKSFISNPIATSGVSLALFDEKVAFPNLEELHIEDMSGLKLICQIEMVIRNLEQLQRLEICKCELIDRVIAAEGEMISKMLFPKLEFLKLEGLSKLVRFCSSDFLELRSLKELWIENCPALKSFISNPLTTATSGVSLALFDEKVVLPNLEELHIEDMGGLKMIWQNGLHEGSFCKLKTMVVRRAEKLENVFPSNMLMSRFMNLECLDVARCELIEEVFDFPPQEQLINFSRLHGIPASQLKQLSISNLPKLKHIWKNDAREREIIFFQKLHDVCLNSCPSLKSIFPATIATHLSELEKLTIMYCGIEEIIDRGGDTETIFKFEFPKLTTLHLYGLEELRTLYPGTHTSDWPILEKLDIQDCPKMEVFSWESQSIGGKSWRSQSENPSRQPFFTVEKVIPKLEELKLNKKDAKSILNGNWPDNLFQKVRFLSLQNFDKESASVLFALLGRFPNLESLHVENRESRRLVAVTELFSCEGLINEENQGRTIPRIKLMKLHSLDKLKPFCKQDCQLDRIFESLETLEVSSCNSLISLEPSINIASFGNLSRLDVWSCEGLLNLVTSSTAQCLGLLTELRIRHCSMVNEVVAREEDDREDQITWGNLKSLKLCYLSSLTYFCSAYHTFNFPSLEEVIIEQCPKIKAFSRVVSITPKLKKVKLAEFNDKERWEGDLNTTIQQLCAELVSFDGIRHLKLSKYPQLKEKWHSEELPAQFFSNLSSLIVDECASSPTAIPSNLLPFLYNLWSLEVQECDLVEEVFDLTLPNAADAPIGTLPKLYWLELIDLPRLKHVWNEEPKGVFDFRNLEVIKIHNCPTLKYIFTSTTCLGLVELRMLEVKDCPLIEEIISKEATACNVEFFPGQAMELEVKNCTSVEEIITSGEEEVVVNTMFSQLNSLVLESLPNLTSFCPSTNILELQSLEKVTVIDCPRIKLFASTILGAQEPNVVVTNEERLGQEGFSTPVVLLFGAEVACRNLKELKVEYNNNIKDLLHGKLPTEYSAKIEVLELTNFPHEETLFPTDILLRLPSLEKLLVNDADFRELFLEQRIVDKKNSDEQVTILRQLKLSKLRKVSQLFQDHSIPDLVIQNLETLEVIECSGLKILMPSLLSFQNLTTLEVSKCHGLTYLMTSATAKSLEKLTRMSITECDMLEEIVSSEGNEGEDEIALSQLEDLELRCLPNFVGFCSGNHTFNFPLLKEVTLIECSKMKFFSKGTLYSPQLTEVHISLDEDQCWEGSLNQTIQKLFSEMGAGNA